MSPVVQRILDLMYEHHVTAAKLTSDLGISHTAVTDWKKGRGSPKVATIADISRYFNVSTDYIITGAESKNFAIPFATKLDKMLISKFHKLPEEIQQEVLSYIDFKIAQTIDATSRKVSL